MAPDSSWAVEQNGIRLRMRMEPAAPVAGQPVRFIVEVATAQSCCGLGLSFTEGSTASAIGSGSCARSGPALVEGPHTYANVPMLAVPAGADGQPVLP